MDIVWWAHAQFQSWGTPRVLQVVIAPHIMVSVFRWVSSSLSHCFTFLWMLVSFKQRGQNNPISIVSKHPCWLICFLSRPPTVKCKWCLKQAISYLWLLHYAMQAVFETSSLSSLSHSGSQIFLYNIWEMASYRFNDKYLFFFSLLKESQKQSNYILTTLLLYWTGSDTHLVLQIYLF